MSEPRDAPPRVDPSLAVALVVAATALCWWTATDRLDLPKQWGLLVATLAAWSWALWRRVRLPPDGLSLALLAAPLLVLAVAPVEAAARVEGWAGWLAAVTLMLIARTSRASALGAPMTALTLGLSALAWLQAVGAPWFNSGLRLDAARRVVGTLGGPNHLGWMLAMLLPWAGTTLLAARRRTAGVLGLTLTCGALALTGSRAAWAAALLALPAWVPWASKVRRDLRPWLLVGALLAGATVAAIADRVTGSTGLPQRATDLAAPRGTARGRLYLWRVHLSTLPGTLSVGGGPESFVRRWPAWQRRYRRRHGIRQAFHSDLRHAHADLFEVLVDFGLPGLLLGIYLLLRALRRRPDEGSIRGPPLGSLAALGVAGLAAAPLFFAPTLALGAVCLGLRLGPGAPARPWALRLVPLVALAVALVPLSRRLISEVHRSTATATPRSAAPAVRADHARRALRWDDRNPRAWIELAIARSRLGRSQAARAAWEQAYRDLPLDAIRQRLRRLPRRRGRPRRLDGRRRP